MLRAMLAAPSRTPWSGVGVRLVEEPASFASAGGALRCSDPSVLARRLRLGIEELLDRVLAGVTRVAVLAGGGVDSSILLAHAVAWAKRTGGTAFGVALDFASPGDDRPHREALRAHLGCAILEVKPEDAAPRFDTCYPDVDAAPLTWPSALMEIEAMGRARAEGAECVLTGVGADELFDGDPTLLSALPLRRALPAAWRLAGFSRPRAPLWTWAARPRLAARVPAVVKRARARLAPLALPDWAGPRWERLARARRDAAIDAMSAGGRGPVVPETHRLHLAWLRHQQSAAAGVPRVDPFLDRGFVEEVTSWPAHMLLAGDLRRGLFREAARGLVPESLRLRTDKAIFEPGLDRFLDAAPSGRARLASLADVRFLASAGAVRAGPFGQAARTFLDRRDEGWGWSDVWPVLAVEAFARKSGRAS